eukprot:15367212-Ditylum_brightwellii.AAC.3
MRTWPTGEFALCICVGNAAVSGSKFKARHSYGRVQCTKYTHNSHCNHEKAVKLIVYYLIGAKNQQPGQKGDHELWGHEDYQDPSCIKSWTGFVLMLGGTPILWVSKLQNEIACLTMKSEYIALAHELSQQLDLDWESLLVVSTVLEGNNGALMLTSMPMSRMTPQSKHIRVKYHWFRSWINDPGVGIVVKPIDLTQQKGDIFTKPLGRVDFVEKQKMIMGWQSTNLDKSSSTSPGTNGGVGRVPTKFVVQTKSHDCNTKNNQEVTRASAMLNSG